MNKYAWLTVAFCFVFCQMFAQDVKVDEVITTPSKEIYDLLQDKKGFIWLGDELGIRRYDGVSFTNYTNAEQSSLSMTSLIEDEQGRVWCHNFNNQIFYIEQERMHLLKAYDATSEKVFPHMGLCGRELLATSFRGLFVCNTQTLNCRYIRIAQTAISSLTIINDKAILYGNGSWFIYQAGKGVAPLPVSKEIKDLFVTYKVATFELQPNANQDTLYAICNPGALLFTFTFSNNQLQLQAVHKYESFINAVTVKEGAAWVHTQKESISLNGSGNLKGYNISCILKDKEGNTWYSSLDNGLMMSYAHEPWNTVVNTELEQHDFVRSMEQSKDYFVLGSRQGRVLVKDSWGKTIQQYTLPVGSGAVDKIMVLDHNNFMIAATAGLFLLQPDEGKLQPVHNNMGVKDFAASNKMLYLATSRGVLQATIDTASNSLLTVSYSPLFNKRQRCRAIRYDDATGILWIAYADGLFKWDNTTLEQVLYNGETIYASSLEIKGGKVYAGTFSGQLIVLQQNTLRRYSFKRNAFDNAVVRMTLCNNHLYIFNAFGINVFDTDKERFIFNQSLPYLNGSDVWDAAEIEQDVLLSATGKLYKVPVHKVTVIQPPPLYLRYLNINNKDTVFASEATLSSVQNNLSFYIASPWYNRNNTVTIRYRLISANDDSDNDLQWYELESNERIIQLNALAPGVYKLIIEAGINDNFQPASLPIYYNFYILKPWYNQWWFYCLVTAVIAAVLYGLYRYRITQLLKLERLRREISSNLHDEVGSTVSSINIYSQLIKNGQPSEDYIDMIQANTVQVMNSLDDLVWNINPKYDTLEQLIDKMKLFAQPFLNDNGISCQFDAAIEKENKTLLPEVRTDIYLIFKEAVNNVVKHSRSAHCHINIVQKGKFLRMSVKDNGKGFDVNTATLHRNGLSSMQYRAQKLKGNLHIVSTPGSGSEIILSCSIYNNLKIT